MPAAHHLCRRTTRRYYFRLFGHKQPEAQAQQFSSDEDRATASKEHERRVQAYDEVMAEMAKSYNNKDAWEEWIDGAQESNSRPVTPQMCLGKLHNMVLEQGGQGKLVSEWDNRNDGVVIDHIS
jgi:hypothetical protein